VHVTRRLAASCEFRPRHPATQNRPLFQQVASQGDFHYRTQGLGRTHGDTSCQIALDTGLEEVVTDPLHQAVGTVPPSITYSVPVIAPALGETTNAMSSATSRGVAGRPSGMPPRDFMMICLPPS